MFKIRCSAERVIRQPAWCFPEDDIILYVTILPMPFQDNFEVVINQSHSKVLTYIVCKPNI
jgi:hypothetical protein